MPAFEPLAETCEAFFHSLRRKWIGVHTRLATDFDTTSKTVGRLGRTAFAATFPLRRSFHASLDATAGLRDRLPRQSNVPASTLLAYGAVGLMAAILLNDLLGPTPAVSSIAATSDQRPEWVEIARPHGAFALESPALEGLESRYTARRHRSGGGRKDELTFGDALARGIYVRVLAYRPGTEGMADPDPFEATVALAAESSIDAELEETDRKLATKFGALPLVAMRVDGGERTRRCISAASAWNDPRLGLVAWWCSDGPELVPHGEFACLLDRLALMSAGGDDRLAEFFARAELRRRQCGSPGSVISPTPKRPDDWIHARHKPQLRGRIVAR